MHFADKFLKSFFSNYSQTRVSENDVEFVCELTATGFLASGVASIQGTFNFLQPNDQLTFTITFGDSDSISFFSGHSDFSDFKTRLEAEHQHLEEGEPINAVLEINKKHLFGSISIYDLSVFTKTLEDLTFSEVFAIFNRVLKKDNFVIFSVLNLESSFNTGSIFFSQAGSLAPNQCWAERRKRLDSLNSVSNYTNFEEHRLTPDDFEMQVASGSHENLCLLFCRYSVLLSIIYLFDITSLRKNELEFKINGYKSIKGKIDLKTLHLERQKEYFDIYNWAYSSGNLNDKIGLARNIISLHFEKSGEIGLKGHPYQSVLSSYKVYERQNVKQYIEIRNKISDQLLDFNNRANKLIETFAIGFQKSALALISFYISAIVIRVLGKGDFICVFTFDATVLSCAFILGSYIYYRVAKWEVKEQKKRFIKSYKNLKERYTDLLEAEDIERILNNDREYNEDILFIDNKLRMYGNLWKGFLLILISVTLLLYSKNNLSLHPDSIIWKFLFKALC